MKRQKMLYDLHGTCESITDLMGRRLVKTMMTGRTPETEDLLEEYDIMRLKRLNHAWKSNQLPSICTHDMQFDAEDPILNRLRQCRLFNTPEDRVKVVYHPDFISGTGAVLPLDYDQFVRACHLGVFPSYYEPWGYTPLECVALGIPTVTSDLAGFGTYVRDSIPDHEEKGIHVLSRKNTDFFGAAENLARIMEGVVTMGHRDRVQLRNRVEDLSELFDWRRLRTHYDEALEESKNRFVSKKSH
jgi:glycogen(starch) synthase